MILRERLGDGSDCVALSVWQEHFPPGEEASADAYDRLLADRGTLAASDKMG